MRRRKIYRFISILCAVAVLLSTANYNRKTVQAEINQTTKLSHTMATQSDFDAVKGLYIPRCNTKTDADTVKVVTYDSTNNAMKFKMGEWYTSSGAKIDITSAIASILQETSSITEKVTIGVSAELKTGIAGTGGFGFLTNNNTSFDAANAVYVSTAFTKFTNEMTLSDFKTKYASYQNLYLGFWSGTPDIFIKNLTVYYYTGEREPAVEMKEETTIPEGSVGLLLHNITAKTASLVSNYSGYSSGTVSSSGNAMKYTASADNDNNGIKMDVTNYVKRGKSGEVFGASLRVNIENWLLDSNKENKANLFFEVKDSAGNLKSKYMLDSDGPDADGTNLTNSTSKIGAGWLTSLLSGEAKITFDSTDKIYLCTNQKNTVQYYNDMCLWGHIDFYNDPTDAYVTTPTLNTSGDKVTFSLKNLSPNDKNLTIKLKQYKNNVVDSVDEYSMKLVSGIEEKTITLPASQGSEISIFDENGNNYVKPIKLGTTEWVGTWASAQLTASGDTTPPAPGLQGNTYRQIIRTSTGGTQLRLTFSNEYGKSDLEIKSVHLADQQDAGNSQIDASTDTVVTFGGSGSVIIPAGQTITSDVVEYHFNPLEKIAVSSWFGKVPEVVTSHTGARCTNWLSIGNRVSDAYLGATSTATSWYFLEGLDAMSPSENKAIVCFGDSITDGYGVTIDKYQRWSDVLATNLNQNSATANLSVLNKGIGGNSIFGGLGPAGKSRYDRDVINKAGVGYVVLLLGINDIGSVTSTNSATIADSMIAEYQTMITKAHAKGIKIYGGTILPFKGNSYYDATYGTVKESIRQTINTWIKSSSSGFDGIIDFATYMASPTDPQTMDSQYINDYLHPNTAGYTAMGNLVYETIFKK